jgi:alkylation response protein AidB-like acyl-CoA dehydrogenase
VRTPKGFKEAYAQYVEGGWPALSCDPAYGGQGLPVVLNQCFYEMLNSANQAWTMYPGLSHGAYECLQRARHARAEGAVPAQAGQRRMDRHHVPDRAALRHRPRPAAQQGRAAGRRQLPITGRRSSSAPASTTWPPTSCTWCWRGCRTRRPAARASRCSSCRSSWSTPTARLGARNAIFCGALEHKMGIHGNATCQMNLDGATGWLVGQPNKGLAAMFVMMNAARLGVGNQSLGLTEVAYQNAVAYAKDRLQMRALSGPKARTSRPTRSSCTPTCARCCSPRAPTPKAAARWRSTPRCCSTRSASCDDEDERQEAADQVALLTPIVKAFLTDNGWIATSHCMQVFGGHGYIREWGMEQFVRDARINMIYEGTNTIQALDLLGRKVLGDNGAKLKKFGKLIATSSRKKASTRRCRSSSTRWPTWATR